jgi:Ca-activated chloride channel family protein
MKRLIPLAPVDLPVAPDSDDAGFGALKTVAGLLPLKALEIEARIVGLVAETTLRETFVNAFPEPLEAVYIFPLPPSAAVTQFTMTAQGRRVEGTLMERTAAHEAYREALRDGHRAALAEQDRQDVFTISVGNLPPGEAVTVDLRLASRLPCEDGEVTFRFPLVVAPRYIPGRPLPGERMGGGTAADTDATPDASRITPPVLLPGFPNPVRLSLRVDLDSGEFPISDLRASLHSVLEEQDGAGRRIRLQPGERLDRDFILRFRMGAEEIRTALQLSPDPAAPDEGTFLLTVVPPAGRRPRNRAPWRSCSIGPGAWPAGRSWPPGAPWPAWSTCCGPRTASPSWPSTTWSRRRRASADHTACPPPSGIGSGPSTSSAACRLGAAP